MVAADRRRSSVVAFQADGLCCSPSAGGWHPRWADERKAMSQLDRGASSRIMYIERRAGSLSGRARIGRVTFSKSGRTVYYRGRTFRSLAGQGFKANFFDVETRDEY